MAETPRSSGSGLLAEVLRPDVRLFPRLAAVFRFDAAVYAEIEADSQALPAAFAVVIGAAVLAGLGAPSFAGIFLGTAGAIISWAVVSALVWAVGSLAAEAPVNYVALLTCLGFAYAWNGLGIGSSLPVVGPLFEWAALGLWAVALFQAARQVLRVTTGRAIVMCAVALGLPLGILLVFGG